MKRKKDKHCPACRSIDMEYPALSRRGDYDVCPACGEREAYEDLFDALNLQNY